MRRRDSRPGSEPLGGGASCRVAERGGHRDRPPAEPPRLRLFIALDLPEEVRLGIHTWGREALADPDLRRRGPSSLRIILAFLGSPADEAGRLIGAIRQIGEGASAPTISLCDIEPIPSRGRPRVFVLSTNSPETEILQIGLRAVLTDRSLYKPDGRPFRPHVTIARVRAEGQGSRRSRLLQAFPSGPLPPLLLEPFRAGSIALYSSELHRSGVRHRLLGGVELSS